MNAHIRQREFTLLEFSLIISDSESFKIKEDEMDYIDNVAVKIIIVSKNLKKNVERERKFYGFIKMLHIIHPTF